MSDAKKDVIEQLLGLARFIRRKGSPDMAMAAVEYEKQLATDLAVRERELTQLASVKSEVHEVAA